MFWFLQSARGIAAAIMVFLPDISPRCHSSTIGGIKSVRLISLAHRGYLDSCGGAH